MACSQRLEPERLIVGCVRGGRTSPEASGLVELERKLCRYLLMQQAHWSFCPIIAMGPVGCASLARAELSHNYRRQVWGRRIPICKFIWSLERGGAWLIRFGLIRRSIK